VDLHRLAEERSVAFHRAVLERMREDPAILARARARVDEWLQSGQPHLHYAGEWRRILRLPFGELENALLDPSEEGRALRQVTPFAGALPPKQRWTIWKEFARRRGV
jgi:hypothetical protein